MAGCVSLRLRVPQSHSDSQSVTVWKKELTILADTNKPTPALVVSSLPPAVQPAPHRTGEVALNDAHGLRSAAGARGQLEDREAVEGFRKPRVVVARLKGERLPALPVRPQCAHLRLPHAVRVRKEQLDGIGREVDEGERHG